MSFEKIHSSLSNGMKNVHSINEEVKDGYRKNIKVYSPVKKDNSKYVKYVYTIKDATTLYNDYAEFYWNFLGKDWECSINNLDINIKFDKGLDKNVFPHTYGTIDKVDIGSNYIRITAGHISSGIALDARVVFPSSYISNASKIINEKYDFNTLNKIEEKMALNRKNYDLSNKIYFVIVISAIIWCIFVVTKIPKNKGIKKYKELEHNPELLNNYSLADYSCMNTQYLGYSNTNLLMATILDLANKKYIKMEALKKVDKHKDKYEYYISADISKDFNKLTDYEKNILNYIFNKKLSNEIVISDFEGQRFELNDRFKDISKDYKLGQKFNTKYSKIDSDKIKEFYDVTTNNIWKMFCIGVLVLALIFCITTFCINPVTEKFIVIFIGIFVSIIYLVLSSIIIYSSGVKLKDEYTAEYNKLQGLKKYLNDYSLIKEKYPIELVLWERYLVFATMFGIAEKVAKEFKEELLANGYDEDYINTMYPMIYVGMHTNTYTSYASGNGSSGSSSSGGYSGGGGGGRRWRRRWRRWRWRWSFLKKCIKICNKCKLI
ncbi:MAG: DUF2207 domain-containing protein [Clostridia bacterium]